MTRFSTFFACATLLLSTACTDAGFAVANAPAIFSSNAEVKQVAYGPEKNHQLDLYKPKHAGAEKLDTIVFFYGGGWKAGDRKDYAFVAQALAEKGYVVVIPDYRKYPDVKFPSFVEDGARALAWTHDHVKEYGGDTSRIFLAGHSAGAHLAALLVADEKYLAAHAKKPEQVVRAFAGLAGPYAFTPEEPDYIAIFGPPERYPLMQVPNFIDGTEPPMLLMHGGADETVDRKNLEQLEARIRAKHGTVRSIIYPGVGHIGIMAALSWMNPAGKPVLDDMTRFFSEQK